MSALHAGYALPVSHRSQNVLHARHADAWNGLARGRDHLRARCRICGTAVVLPVNALQGAVDRLRQYRVFRLDPAMSDLVGICESCAAR